MKERLKGIFCKTTYTPVDGAVANLAVQFTERGLDSVAESLIASGVKVPLVNIGQKIYIIDEPDEGEPHPLAVTVTSIGWSKTDKGESFWAVLDLPLGLKVSTYADEDSFGRTWFTSEKAAEEYISANISKGV